MVASTNSYVLIIFDAAAPTNDYIQAGRLPTLDSLAQRYYTADKAVRETIYAEAKAAGENASYYVRVMEKLASGADEWVNKEVKRLNGILAKRTMAVSPLPRITRRILTSAV